MFYKISDNVIFRKYKEHGYITDNSEFGYRMLNDKRRYLGESYVSASGAVMLSMLGRTPRHIDDIVDELIQIFVGVDADTLKQDTIEFFDWFAGEGFLCKGVSANECCCSSNNEENQTDEPRQSVSTIKTGDCSAGAINENEFLRSIHIEIADACNERCVHCYIPHERKNSIIDSNLFYNILEQARAMNIVHVTLSGGEPLIHRDIINFLKRCRELDLSVNVLSNLTLLSEEIISEMKENPLLSVQTSLYSMDASSHDTITNLPGSFEMTKNGILRLCEAGIPVQISCPIIKQNKDSFIDVVRWGREQNIAVATEPVIFASYDHSCCNLENRLSLTEVEEALALQIDADYANQLHITAKDKENLTGENPICSVCRYSCCVAATGDVFPCVGWQTNVIGNLNHTSLSKLWSESKTVKSLRKIKRKQFAKCVDCVDRGYCTVCMMWNSNETADGDAFSINNHRCKVAAIMHKKADAFI